jgi:stage V sporulation protein R
MRQGGLPTPLEEARQRIEQLARDSGLDFFDVCFELCDYEEINMIAAYGGFPVRYPHWRWGMEYLRMQKGYDYGLQKIYELVINTDPAWAYLLDNNTFVDQQLVMAHVYAHVDFFKNNAWFAHTNRKMLDGMANHAARVRRMIDRVGATEVERWIDLALSLDNLVDPYSEQIRRGPFLDEEEAATGCPPEATWRAGSTPPRRCSARRRGKRSASSGGGASLRSPYGTCSAS